MFSKCYGSVYKILPYIYIKFMYVNRIFLSAKKADNPEYF